MTSTTPRSLQAQAEARVLVKKLRKSNRKLEQRGGVVLPDEEYGRLEQELTEKLLKRAA